jgi:hypothetical protein
MNKFQQTMPVEPTATTAYSDKQFLHKVESAVILPLWQSSITAVMSMVLTGIVLYLMDAIDFIKPMLVVGCLTWVFTWLFLQRRWLNLTTLETHMHMDINRDGLIGKKPEKKETVIWVNEQRDNSFSSERKSLPIDDDDLVMLADGLIHRGRKFSRREWTPKKNGFSDDDWRALQADCLKFRLVEQVGAGFELTRAGKAMMKHYAALSPTPVMDEVET